MVICQCPRPQRKMVLLLLFALGCLGASIQYLTLMQRTSGAEQETLSNYMVWLNNSHKSEDTQEKGESPIRSPVCHLPDFDPFDQTILKFIKNFTLKCSNESNLTIMDEKGCIYLNESGFEAENKSIDVVFCYYFSVEEVKGKKHELKYGPKIKITAEPTQTDAKFVGVVCEESNKPIHHNVHYYVPRPGKELQQRNLKAQKEGRPNVLLMHIDSMSRQSFIRNLPKSYEYLTKRMGSVVMRGMTKLGINTFPNMLALLAGYKMNPGDPGDGVPYRNTTSRTYDDLPLVWTNFSRAGYVTMWLDEMAALGLFYYNTNQGFMLRQTDYFPRPVMLQRERLGLKYKDLCFGNTPSSYIVLDYIQKFITSMKNTIYFAFTSIVRISHDNLNAPQAMDGHLSVLLKRLYDEGDLKNTVLIMFGDHGLRFGAVRKTLIGSVEDKMPFMSIYLPQWMREEKPHLQASLESNSGRLLSWFDMHEMLLDLASNNLDAVSRGSRAVGVSPLRPLPENRSCADAGIPINFCVCMTPVKVDVATAVVREAAMQVVDHVNALLRRVPGKPCAKLWLARVESAQATTHSDNMMLAKGFVEWLRVTLETSPGSALLEAVVERRASHAVGQVIGDVERINRYGNQSWCVHDLLDPRIQTYCLCRVNGSDS